MPLSIYQEGGGGIIVFDYRRLNKVEVEVGEKVGAESTTSHENP
jgi:hypothetical protein